MASLKLIKNKRGFTLLEVMVALAIMGLSLMALFLAQSRSMRMAEKARTLIVATELARKKLIDCKFDVWDKGFSQIDYESNGDFAEQGHPEVEWECFAYRFDIPPPNAEVINKALKSQTGGDFGKEMGAGFTADALAPFFGLISSTLGDSIREVVLIVRWKNDEYVEDMKVVTHMVNRAALTLLTSQIPDMDKLPPGFTIPGMPTEQPK